MEFVFTSIGTTVQRTATTVDVKKRKAGSFLAVIADRKILSLVCCQKLSASKFPSEEGKSDWEKWKKQRRGLERREAPSGSGEKEGP